MRFRGLLAAIVAAVVAVPVGFAAADPVDRTGGTAELALPADSGVLRQGDPMATAGPLVQRSARSLTGVPRSIRREARKSLKASPIVAGKHPQGPMRAEPYIEQSACFIEMPGVVAFRELLLKTFPREPESLQMYNIARGCNTPGISEHEEGRALDFEAHVDDPLQYAQARRLLKWLTKRHGYNAKRWGIMYIIFDQQIWAQYNQRWRWMSDRGSVTDNHQDHIHFSFTWNGALRQSSYWTGQVRAANYGPCPQYEWHFGAVNLNRMIRKPRTRPCGSPARIPADWRYSDSVMYWQSGSRVEWLQQFLTEEGVYDGAVDGAFGPVTFYAVRAWQRAHHLRMTGVWDPVTQNASGRTVDRRSESRITGWVDDPVVLPRGRRLAVPLTVSTDGSVPREVLLQYRSEDGDWDTLVVLRTTAAGRVTVPIMGRSQPGKYRVRAPQTSAWEGARTPARAISPS